jgi:DNA polymerase-3 subunit gamma/tau
MAVLRDLAEITHWLSVVKITPAAAEDPTVPPDERDRGRDMAARLPMRALSRMWQMLLKALEEVALAPNAMMAAEMAVIRLTHVADLPDPETLIRKLQSQQSAPGGPAGMTAPPSPGAGTRQQAAFVPGTARAAVAPALAQDAPPQPATFAQVVDLIRERRDMKLLVEVENDLRLVRYAPGRIEFEPGPGAAPDLAARLSQRLQTWTGSRWGVSVTGSGGAPSIAEARDDSRRTAEVQALQNPLVQAVLAAFPGARIAAIRSLAPPRADDALPEVEDEWDPFEDD